MAEDHVTSGLLRLRAELAGQHQHHLHKAQERADDLVHIDATLRLLGYDGPDLTVDPKKASTAGLFHRNELKRYVYKFLRENPEGVTARQIAEHVCLERGWDSAHKPFMDALVAKVGRYLNEQGKRKGVATCERAGDQFIWRRAQP